MVYVYYLGLLLAAVFSLSLAMLVTEKRLVTAGPLARVLTTGALSLAFFVGVVVLLIMAIWPPYWPL